MTDKSNSKNDKKMKFHDAGLSRDLEIERSIYMFQGMLPTTRNTSLPK